MPALPTSLADERTRLAVLLEVPAERWIGSSSLEEAALPKNERDECEKEQADDDADDDDPDGNRARRCLVAQLGVSVRLDGSRVVMRALMDSVHRRDFQLSRREDRHEVDARIVHRQRGVPKSRLDVNESFGFALQVVKFAADSDALR